MSLEKIVEVDNPLMMRKEVTATFSAGSGGIRRRDAADTVAKSLGIDSSRVFSMKLEGEAGTTRLKGFFYVYESGVARSRLSKHIQLRNERKVKESQK